MKAKIVEPLEHTNYPSRDVIQSFAEISRNFLSQRLDSRTLPHNRMVRIVYDDGIISSEEICLAIMHSCRSFGSVAVVSSELYHLSPDYDDVTKVTYNRVICKDFEIDIANPIKSIIVKDYEINRSLHGESVEAEIKLYFRDLNYSKMCDGDAYTIRRDLYPCFFLVN